MKSEAFNHFSSISAAVLASALAMANTVPVNAQSDESVAPLLTGTGRVKMKTALSRLIATAAIALLAIGARAQTYGGACANPTLLGDYSFRISGEIFVPNSNTIAAYRDGVAMTHFDGNGGLSQVDWVVANGVPVPGPKNEYGFHDKETGWYKVNPDCTGEAEIDFPTPPHGTSGAIIKLEFVIGDGGRTLHTIVSSLTPPNTHTPVPANIHSDAVRVSGD